MAVAPMKKDYQNHSSRSWNPKSRELAFLLLYAAAFYAFIIHRSLQLSHDHYTKLFGLRSGWFISQRFNHCVHHLNCFRELSARKVVLRMISFGYDYHWAHQDSRSNVKKHIQHCQFCKSGKTCYQFLQERSVQDDKFAFTIYLSYLVYAPLYLAGPIVSFNAFASQLDVPQNNFSIRDVAWYGVRWAFSLLLMELMTHLFYYNAFATSGAWRHLSPVDVFIVGYGVLNFMWLKFFLIWRYFRFWSLICGIEAPENMPRYMYIPLGGSQRKLQNIWVVFTFVALWHDLEWKLLSWAWLTCLFFIPEMLFKSAANAFQATSAFREFVLRELHAVAGAVTITCLMVANLVGFVIGASGINWLISRFLEKDGIPVLAGMLVTFYVGTKLMFHVQDFKQSRH
ncbi:hypothetical protein L484_011595 [Morus notabilis]|uniref:Membrane-bound O-acyltransferase C24H6.01c n=1 Tax=Morus notabilis TaxID=981085 RepID=W9RAF1_9ROSA|nr:hypothetical protein L484_011595 [Morus notabilis]